MLATMESGLVGLSSAHVSPWHWCFLTFLDFFCAGVIAFLAAAVLLAGEYFFPQMSSVKTRRHYVIGDLAFSGECRCIFQRKHAFSFICVRHSFCGTGFWAFLYGVGFIYLASQWTKSDSSPAALAAGNNLRAAIAFSFFSIFTWVPNSFLTNNFQCRLFEYFCDFRLVVHFSPTNATVKELNRPLLPPTKLEWVDLEELLLQDRVND